MKYISILVVLILQIDMSGQIGLIDSKVGVGTLTPDVPVHIKGDTFKIQNEAGVNKFFMNEQGNIGIGRNPGNRKLDVQGTISARGQLLYLGNSSIFSDNSSLFKIKSNNSSYVQMMFVDAENTPYGRITGISDGGFFGLLDGDGNWGFQMVKDKYYRHFINNVAQSHVSSGVVYQRPSQLQIGWNQTGNRFAYIDLQGDDTYTDYGLRLMRYNAGANARSLLSHRGTGDLWINTVEAADILLRTQNTTQVTITPGGKVGIGTINPGEKLHVNGNIQYSGMLINASDKKLKKNIQNFNYGIEEVLQLNPVTYQFKDIISDRSNATSVGLIAQELQKVAPGLVTSIEQPLREKIDADIEKTLQQFLAINESSIKYMLINAIKSQQILIEEQQDRIEHLYDALGINSNPLPDNLMDRIDIALENSEQMLRPYIGQNSPNPTDGQTIIKYFLPENSNSARVVFYNLNGQILEEVIIKGAGQGEINLDIDKMISGNYLYSFYVDNAIVDTKTMVITK